ncbi:MAG TPA: hypothetical protein VFC54_05335 [Pseudolabrys sp.]|nr:hypothetical protein [Pseudolabrys sp.]
MSSRLQTRSKPAIWFVALGIIVTFFFLQVATLSYGTRINGIPFINNYKITSDIANKSSLKRDQLVGSQTRQSETLDVWMARFKLYSVDADEILSVMALARIKPRQMQFDPKFYQYGGAFLYPLGAWYQILSWAGVIHIAPLDQFLARPQEINKIWTMGRAFVLVAFSLSAVVLFLTLLEIAPAAIALLGLAIYVFCPASIMFSQVLKPHWYALLWVNTALLIVVRAFVRNEMAPASALLLSIAIGLAVGSAATFSMFAPLLWGALVVLVIRHGLKPAALVLIPIGAFATFLLTNPYYLLDWPAAQAERTAAAAWFHPSADIGALMAFVQNSLVSGFGLAFVIMLFATVGYFTYVGPAWRRLLALALVFPLLVMAIMTANLDTWMVNFRYIPYFLPAALIAISIWQWRYRTLALTLCAFATIVQAAPLKLAYSDENSLAHSTRLRAAAWIDTHIPDSDPICLTTETLAPFEVPPFRFDRHALNTRDCHWKVQVERNPRAVEIGPEYQLEKRFTPRLTSQRFPMVWEHINPQITIYRKNG